MVLAQQEIGMTIRQPLGIVWAYWWSIILSTIILLQLLRRICFTRDTSAYNISRLHVHQNIVCLSYEAAS